MSARPPVILNLKPSSKGTALVAFFDVLLPSGMMINACSLHQKDGHYWIGTPGQSFVRKDGSRGWNPIVSFGDEKTENKFQDLVTPFAVRALEEKQGRVGS
jgi:hypothetical protein